MDIAAFVGFAARGPLHCPVPIEDPKQFASIFGADFPLVWDKARGEWVSAHLGPAVNAFLRNGGRRCWVVRVADLETAETAVFAVPGLMQVAQTDPADPGSLELRPAFAWARSQGSWADGLRVSASLTMEPVTFGTISFEPLGVRVSKVTLQSPDPPRPGDVLRLTYHTLGCVAMMLVERVAALPSESPEDPLRTTYSCEGRAVWFEKPGDPLDFVLDSPPSSPLGDGVARWFEGSAERTASALALSCDESGLCEATLNASIGAAPAPGVMLRIGGESSPLWLMVTDVTPQHDEVSSAETVLVSGRGMVWGNAPDPLLGVPDICERLVLELHTAMSGEDPVRIARLDFARAKGRYWGALPTDFELFAPGPSEQRETYGALWRQAADPRFPLAGSDPGEVGRRVTLEEYADPSGLGEPPPPPLNFSFPIGMGFLPEQFTHAYRSALPDLVRNGLGQFDRSLFLDEALAGDLIADLMSHADAIRYTARQTRPLRGIHAILSVDEATLVAVPDAIHRAWTAIPVEGLPSDLPIPPVERPEWFHALGCDPQVTPDMPLEAGNFRDDTLREIDAPELMIETQDDSGAVTFTWTAPGTLPGEPDPGYRLAESTNLDFTGARTIYEGPAQRFTLYGRSQGDYFYHVQVLVGRNTSDWSNGLAIRQGPQGGWALADPAQPSLDLLAIHRALLRMCAARGDLFAILSLPEHADEDAAIEQVALLHPSISPVFATEGLLVLPLGYGEGSALSHGAVYHPWLIEHAGGQGLRRLPPDGAVCGMFARRALARGAWIAPANIPLSGIVALTPPISPRRWLDLLESQINLVRQEPYGFVTLSADTLSDDPDLVPVNVRRLLHLLRRLIVQMGADFVFEPAGGVFQRMVRRNIEGVLTHLFTRGAFAGKTTEQAYQVLVRSTPQDADEGRFIVDVKVAPSMPMSFLTVRLVQTGGHIGVSEAS